MRRRSACDAAFQLNIALSLYCEGGGGGGDIIASITVVMIGVDIVIVVAEQLLAQQSASCSIDKPDPVVVEEIMAAPTPLCNTHAVAGIRDGKHAVAEEEPGPVTGDGEAYERPFGGHVS